MYNNKSELSLQLLLLYNYKYFILQYTTLSFRSRNNTGMEIERSHSVQKYELRNVKNNNFSNITSCNMLLVAQNNTHIRF